MQLSHVLLVFASGGSLFSSGSAFLSSPSSHRYKYNLSGQNQYRIAQRTFGVTSKRLSSCRLYATEDDDDDDDEPLADGIDSVSWLPTVIGAKSSDAISSVREGAEILPLFPLGGIVYTPNSEHVLNIFEPRYRQMYTDILMNGSKRFVVVMSHPQEKGRFAQMGVLFELKELKEVSEQTNDQIKYICSHRVTGRVKLHRILNPQAWETRDTYLKVEGTIFDDTGKDDEEDEQDEEDDEEKPEEKTTNDVYGAFAAAAGAPLSDAEKDLKTSFADLVDIQHELEEDVRFTKASVNSLAVAPGPGEKGLWQTIRLWQAYADQRLVARQNELQQDFQDKLQDFLKKEKGMKKEELPSAISFQDLSPSLQKEVQDLQKRMSVELEPLILESTLTMQKILEAEDHEARCKLLRYFVDAERKRLNAKKTLLGMFSGASSSSASESEAADIPREEQLLDDTPLSSIFDEPDAFQ